MLERLLRTRSVRRPSPSVLNTYFMLKQAISSRQRQLRVGGSAQILPSTGTLTGVTRDYTMKGTICITNYKESTGNLT